MAVFNKSPNVGAFDDYPPGIVSVAVSLLPDDTAPIGGEPFHVGSANYAATRVVQAKSIEIRYTALGQEWHVYGKFGDPVGGNNPFLPTFYDIVAGIRHVKPAAPPPSPTPTPTVSRAWFDPNTAVLNAERDLGLPAPSLPISPEDAYRIRNLYALVSVDVGSYNSDTQGFYAWLKDYLAAFSGKSTSNTIAQARQRATAQVKFALQHPDSPIARKLRDIAAGRDPLRPSPGPQAYWDYLLAPDIVFEMSPDEERGFRASFGVVVSDYQSALVSGSPDVPDFGTFLAKSRFYSVWFSQ